MKDQNGEKNDSERNHHRWNPVSTSGSNFDKYLWISCYGFAAVCDWKKKGGKRNVVENIRYEAETTEKAARIKSACRGSPESVSGAASGRN